MATDDAENVTGPRQYRVKLLHADGTVETAFPLMVANEADALKQVWALSLSHAVELWGDGRLVTRLALRRGRPKQQLE